MRTLIETVRNEALSLDPQISFFYGSSMSDLHKWDVKANDFRLCQVIDKAPYVQFHIASMTMAKGQGKVSALCVLAYRTLTANNGLGGIQTQMQAMSTLLELINKNLAAKKWILQGDIALSPLFREPNFELTSGAMASFQLIGSNSELINCC